MLCVELLDVTDLVVAEQLICPLVAEEDVVSAVAHEQVAISAAMQFVDAAAALERVAAPVAEQKVQARAAGDPVVAVAAVAENGHGDRGVDRDHVIAGPTVEPNEVEVLRVELHRLEAAASDDDEQVAVGVALRLFCRRVDRRHHLELLGVIGEAIEMGPGAKVERQHLAGALLRLQQRHAFEIRRHELWIGLLHVVEEVHHGRQFRRTVGAGLRRPIEEPDVEQIHAGAKERDEAEGGAETEIQVGGKERIERALEVEDALRTLVEQPHELVEVDLAVAIGVAEIRADRAPQAASRAGLRDDHVQLGSRADRGGERHFRRVAAAVEVGQINAVSELIGIHIVTGERQPDAACVVADVDVGVKLHAAEDPGEERGEDRERLLKAEADVRQVGHVPRDEIDVLAEEQAEGGGERVVEDWEGDLAVVELLERCEGPHAVLTGGGGLVGLERRGSHGGLAEELRFGSAEHGQRAEREPSRRGSLCQRVGHRRHVADGLQEFFGFRARICVVGLHEREERHRTQARLLRHVGDDRHLGQQQVDHRLDRLEQVIDLVEQVLDRTAEQAAQIHTDVGDLEIEVVGETAVEIGERVELDRTVRRIIIPCGRRHVRETGVERGREAGDV